MLSRAIVKNRVNAVYGKNVPIAGAPAGSCSKPPPVALMARMCPMLFAATRGPNPTFIIAEQWIYSPAKSDVADRWRAGRLVLAHEPARLDHLAFMARSFQPRPQG